MAITVTTLPNNRSEDVWGRRRIRLLKVTLDSSYPTGGEAFDPATYGIENAANAIVYIQPRFTAVAALNVYTFDKATNKIVATVMSTGAEVADTTDLSTVVLDVIIIEA